MLLALLFAGRGVLAWAFELAGRRAATGVLSQLRLELVEKRLRHEPVALDGVESAEIATLATHGIGPLEAYFGRFLPQVVLALVVPVAVLAWVVAIDVTSALVMLVTLPLVPVFMVVIGRYTERKARARAQALALLATRFLDVVRGLPTLRAYNRSRAQADSLAGAGDDYRRTTMQTLRVAFLSGAVLELAATLGIALVAVTIGVRLVDGDIGFEAGLTVLLLAPELYLPLRSVAAQYHASADGLAVGERLLELTETTQVVGARTRRRTGTNEWRDRPPPGRLVRLSGAARARARRHRPRASGRRDGGARGPERQRQEHARVHRSRPARAEHGPRPPRRSSEREPTTLAAWRSARRLGAAARHPVHGHRRGQHPARRSRCRRRARTSRCR